MRRKPKGSVTICQCLYCGTRTGAFPSPLPAIRATVCGAHMGQRDEAREIAAGMRPWNPAPPWEKYHFGKPAPEEVSRAAQAAWDAEQARIIEYNRAAKTRAA